MDAQPNGIAVHNRLLVVAEGLIDDVEPEVEEEVLALVEGRRLASNKRIKGRQPLLTVKYQQRRPAPFRLRSAGFHGAVRVPDQQVARRVAAVYRFNELANLV